MKIGYPCINLSLECRSSKTFRLKNYSENKLKEIVKSNLDCLSQILEYNRKNNLFFFRITSDLIPFASHPVMKFNWQDYFKQNFFQIGQFIKKNKMRITMHPGQYNVFNSVNHDVYERSLYDLFYHIDVLDLMELDSSAKVVIHAGGVYGDKNESINRFVERYKLLDESIKNRLVVENDEKSYNLKDCLRIHEKTGIPIILDVYHHECFNYGETIKNAFKAFSKTWKKEDGLPIVHYSSQKVGGKKGNHAYSIDLKHFQKFIQNTLDFNFDLMLEIKDKEKSGLKAVKIIKNDPRFNL
ncbi:MAG: UV DNA damage repair endonuclease UvsE [Candidatus Thorarchaeota archaeon]